MKRILVVLCALSFSSLWAMEQARITVNPMNGNLVVPRHILEQCSRLKADKDFQHQQLQDNAAQELESIELDIDLVGQDKRSMQLALQCVVFPWYSISHLASADLIAVFEAADFIGTPLNILQSLAQRITSELDATTLPQEIYTRIQEVIYTVPRKSVSTILATTALPDIYDHEFNIIKLANRSLDTIDDISLLLSDNTIDPLSVISVDISNNNLTKLPIKLLLHLFPNIGAIVASNNKLTELSTEDFACLPDATVLDVCNNTIQIFKADPNIFMRGTRCNIYLNNNCLSIEDIRRIRSFVNTAPCWRRLSKNQFNFSMVTGEGALCGFLGGSAGNFMIQLITDLLVKKDILLSENFLKIAQDGVYYGISLTVVLFILHKMNNIARNNDRNPWRGNTLIANPNLQYVQPTHTQLQHLKAYASRINKRGLALQ